MNRIILLGNGFDLSHNMKTQYQDFIFSYLKDCFLQAEINFHFKDKLITIKRNKSIYSPKDINNYKSLEELLIFKKNPKGQFNSLMIGTISGRTPSSGYDLMDYSLIIDSPFLDHLLTNCCNFKWVNIENEYYGELKKLLDLKEKNNTQIENLNNSLTAIIELLEKYLANQNSSDINRKYRRIFSAKIKKDEIVTVNMSGDKKPERTLILNFNYTDTIESYLNSELSYADINNLQVNYIHGRLNDKSNPVIFGFGDEIDDDYKRMESEKRQGFLHFLKSFWYFKTSNYQNLIRFIESNDFQVYILGHSCGLSDRTMLNMIFEHANCKSIKIFYHQCDGINNYTELTQEISRHFSDKASMRRKIVPLNKSEEMPQLDVSKEID